MSKESLEVLDYEEDRLMFVRRWSEDSEAIMVFTFKNEEVSVTLPFPAGHWHKRLDSEDKHWQGKGGPSPEWLNSEGKVALTLNPQTFALFTKET